MILALYIFLQSHIVFANPSFEADDLLGYFKSSCPSVGEWTDTALSYSRHLKASLEAIKDDPSCKTISGSLVEISSIEERISTLQESMRDDDTEARLRARQQNLYLQFISTHNDERRADLLSQISEAQLEMAQHLATEDLEKENKYEEQLTHWSELSQSTQVFLSQAIANQQCLQKHPSILTGVGSLGGMIASAVSVANPALSLVLEGTTQLLGQIVEFSKTRKIARKIRSINETTAGIAYRCVLEAMSDQWCRANEARHLFEAKLKGLKFGDENTALMDSLMIFEREVPSTLDWLSQIRSGGDPSNSYEAARRQKVYERESQIKVAREQGIGLIGEYKELFDRETDKEKKWTIEKKVINYFIGSLFSCSGDSCYSDHPLTDVIESLQVAPYFLMGLEGEEIPLDKDGKVIPFGELRPFIDIGSGFTPSLEEVRINIHRWIANGEKRVADEFAEIIQPDALLTVLGAYDIDHRHKISPASSIEKLIEFIRHYPPKDNSRAFEKVYANTLTRLSAILDEVEKVRDSTSEDPAQVARNAIAEIFRLSSLEHNLVFFKGRLELIIRQNILNTLKDASDEEKELAAQFLAANRILDVLNSQSSGRTLSERINDIRLSHTVLQETISTFGGAFRKNIRQTLKRYKKLEEEGEYSGENYKRTRAELCHLLLSLPTWPKRIPTSLCVGSRLESSEFGPKSEKLTLKRINAPYEERVCTFRNFKRELKIFEHWDKTK